MGSRDTSWDPQAQPGFPPSSKSPQLWVGEPCSAGRAVAGTHMHIGASHPAHAGWCACSWAGMHLNVSPVRLPEPPPGPASGTRPRPGHTPSYTLAQPGLQLVPSLKQQLWDNASTTGWVPLSTLISLTVHTWWVQNLSPKLSWASSPPCPRSPKILRPRTGGSPQPLGPAPKRDRQELLCCSTAHAARQSEAPSPRWSPSRHRV